MTYSSGRTHSDHGCCEGDHDPDGLDQEAMRELDELREESRHLRQENERLRGLVGLQSSTAAPKPRQTTFLPLTEPLPSVTTLSPMEAKVALVRALFRGREDVYAVRWTSDRSGRSGYAPAIKGRWGADQRARSYLPLTSDAIEDHLLGKATIGVYPLLKDDTCWFLAADFDGATWTLDAVAFVGACQRRGVPAALERSRSGDGGHVWVFFASPVAATAARRLATALLRDTMVSRAEMDLGSYDRFFPSQDFLPKGGFGNLIALPLQGERRALGNTEFLDPVSLTPWPDQWAFLSQLPRLTREQLDLLAESSAPVSVGPGAIASVLKLSKADPPAPSRISCSIGAVLSVEKAGLPPSLLSSIKHLASLRNPMFYERERLRLSTYRTPRFVKCYDEDVSHLHLPRGTLEDLQAAVQAVGSRLAVTDLRRASHRLSFEFQGALTSAQHAAVKAMLAHVEGVLVAPPGTGKTVMGCAAIAARNLPTLVLVHRRPLLDQWRQQLVNMLGLQPGDIGEVAGGKVKQTGVIDVAMIQSLKGQPDLAQFFSSYGLLVIDECHHVPAFSFDSCVKQACVLHLLGLTATPYRRDGLDGIITMRCGPIRHRISSAESATRGGMSLELVVRETDFSFDGGDAASIQDVFRALVQDDARSAFICDDVVTALTCGRRCLVLSQWKEHVDRLAERLRERGEQPIVLEGGLPKKQREANLERIRSMTPEERMIVIATGQYLGEGFDCPQLDALFLAFPVSYRGKLVQYTGRLLREHDGKTDVMVYDYADTGVPVLKRMVGRRMKTYSTLGFASGRKRVRRR